MSEQQAGNDIKWALEQLENGRGIYRKAWAENPFTSGVVRLFDKDSGYQWPHVLMESPYTGQRTPWKMSKEDVFAHDWEACGK